MAKLTVEEPIKPVITKAKQKRKTKNNKSKLNAVKVETIKNAVLAEKTSPDANKNALSVVKVEVEDVKPNIETKSPSKVSKRRGLRSKKGRKVKAEEEDGQSKNESATPEKKVDKVTPSIPPEVVEKYPIFKNDDLVTKFLSVPMTNNQKGRIRQTYKDNFKGTSDSILPDVIYNKIKSLANDTANLSEGSFRRIRILYNMLKQSVQKEGNNTTEVTKKKNNNKKAKNNPQDGDAKQNGGNVGKKDSNEKKPVVKKEKGESNSDVKQENVKKVKGPKRYVVFVGNLPLDVDREKIMQHFSDLKDHIVDVRIPKVGEGKKSAIAYVELKNEPSYELALSKHHSMLSNKRINVLYSVQQNSKVTKTEAKGKAAKMVALQKSGKLMGSVPLNKKRSQRRAKAKKAQAEANKE